jgi:pentatricopeptide repeat protein
LQKDSLNLRAYYVLGANDFYTPEQYGGGKKAEFYLKRAILLNNQTVSNPYLPSWGKNSAYEMLIRLYINHKQFDEARKYFQEARALFPDDYMINNLAGELINN